MFNDRLDVAYPHGVFHTNNNTKVAICRLRRKLSAHGISIETRAKRGYAMSPENKNKLKARRRT
jgi:DNA-binding response OmpR family regulator